ncbi:hypothetical protein QYF61_027952 [Mycteria americana]|uniref:G-protein coupled receptors family 1 profile domain-containing protein n=1 Tax=Mycteria americana TaxID=33587 RepID=A0AAN7P000_MYCAM|nr:hypothetical protein QYF61_027952 [Mycteria americana]
MAGGLRELKSFSPFTASLYRGFPGYLSYSNAEKMFTRTNPACRQAGQALLLPPPQHRCGLRPPYPGSPPLRQPAPARPPKTGVTATAVAQMPAGPACAAEREDATGAAARPDDRLSQDNSTSPNSTAGLLGNSTHNEFTTIVLPVLYLIIFLASILLNGLAVWIFFHIRNKTSFIFYLKNIVVADLLMTLTFPFKIIQDSQLGPWHFNSFLCRYTTVLFYANMYTTIVFLGLISIDRYLKVVKPFGDSRMYSITFTKILSACVWVVMAFLALPNLILTNGYPTKKNIDDCVKLKSPLGVKWHTAVIYINTCMFVVVLIIILTKAVQKIKYANQE